MDSINPRRVGIGIFVVIMLVSTIPASGAARNWDNGSGDNNWFNGANWTNGYGAPQANQDLVVNGKYSPVADSLWTTDNGGSVTLQGTGPGNIPTVTFNNGLTFGDSGAGDLTITRGTLNSTGGTTRFGYGSGGSGVANISGGNSTLNAGLLYVGQNGNGTVSLSSGGTVNSGTTYLGYNSGSNVGTIAASGANTLLDTSTIVVGYHGEGILRVRANAGAESTTAHVGRMSGSEGLVSIGNTSDLVGAEWTVSGTLYLGNAGTGSMTIAPGILYGEGSVVTNQAFIMGHAGSGIGTASAIGNGTRWTTTGDATVGRLGTGEVTIGDGALMEAQSKMIIGDLAGSTGDVEVDGSGSTLTVAGTMTVGKLGTGTLTVHNSGDAQIGTLNIATEAGHGEVHVNNTGSTLSATNITLGYALSGASALLRIDQGSVQASGNVYLKNSSSVVVHRGVLNLDGNIHMSSSGTRDLTVTAGTLSAGGVHLDWDDFVFENDSYLNVYGNRSGSGNLRRIAGGGGTMSFSGGGRVRLSDGADLSETGDLDMQLTDLDVVENSTVNVDGEMTLGTGVDFMGRSGSTINTGSLALGGSGGSVSMLLETNATVNVDNDMVIADQSGAALSTADVKSTAELHVGGMLTIAKNDWADMDINGTVTSGSGRIADAADTGAEVNVAGSAASWAMTGEFTAGNWGSTWMTISGGAEVSNQAGFLARQGWPPSAIDSHLLVEGSGSAWRNRGVLTLGSLTNQGPQGVLTVSQTGLLESAGMVVNHGSVTITGGGSHWENDGDMTLGRSAGDHTLDILDGATATITGDAAIAAQFVYSQYLASATSTMTIDGSGSRMDIGGALEIGQYNWAIVNVQDGGVLTSGNTQVAVNGPHPVFDSVAHGYITVTGPGSQWDLGTLDLGVVGDGYSDFDATLNITQGGVVNSGNTVIGVESDGKGKVILENSGSTWNTGTLDIGSAGNGILEMSGGAQLSSSTVYLGRESSGDGVATISGASTLWDATYMGNFGVGWAGAGEMTISNGAEVRNTHATIGRSGQGTVSVSGVGSEWSMIGNLLMAESGGSAALNITNGAEVTVGGDFGVGAGGEVTLNNASLIIDELRTDGTFNDGIITWGIGLLKVTGSNGFALNGSGPFDYALTLDTAKTLEVINKTHIDTFNTLTIDNGLLKTGSLDIDGVLNWVGGTVEVTGSGGLDIGDTSHSFATLAVTSGQTLNVSQNIGVGSGGTFEVDGGVVSSNSLAIANGGVVGINRGVFSTGGVFNQGSLVFTNGVSARLQADSFDNFSGTISGSGRLDVAGTFINQQYGGEIRQGNGDELRISASSSVNAGDIRLLGGSLEFVSALENQALGFITGRGTLIAQSIDNAGMMAFSGGYADVFGDVNNTNRIVTSGGGTTTFYDDVVHDGVEIRTSEGCSTVFFGEVSGSGTFDGTGTCYFEGDLKPGSSPGEMTFGGDVVFGSGASLEAELAGDAAGQYDSIDVTGDLALSGTLDVVLIDGFDPELHDTFDILDWGTLSGTFNAVNLPGLDSGLSWDTSDLYNDGGITVVPEPASATILLLGAIAVFRRRRNI